MIFDLNIDYKIRSPKTQSEEKIPNYAELTVAYINFAMNFCYEKGMDRPIRRIWARLQRKMDDALENNLTSIEIEKAELDLIATSLEKTKFPPKGCQYVVILESYVDEKTKENK